MVLTEVSNLQGWRYNIWKNTLDDVLVFVFVSYGRFINVKKIAKNFGI